MLFWLIYILVEAYIQFRYISGGNKPFYLMLFIIRGMASIAHGILLDVQYGTWEYPVLVGFEVCSFWILFDIVLNTLRKKPLFYKGETSGWLDKIPNPYYLTLKFIVFIGAIFFYIEGLKFWKF